MSCFSVSETCSNLLAKSWVCNCFHLSFGGNCLDFFIFSYFFLEFFRKVQKRACLKRRKVTLKIVHILMWAFLGKEFVHQILNIFTFDCEDGRIFLAIFLKVYLLLSTAAVPDRTTYSSSASTTHINRPILLYSPWEKINAKSHSNSEVLNVRCINVCQYCK